jgi:3-methylfumaryl-CoA hydratase
MSPDIEHLQTWIGREQRTEDFINLFQARALAAMLGHSVLPSADEPLPPCWHWLYFLATPATADTGRDGHSVTGAFLPPVPLPRRMWASGVLEFIKPLRLTAVAERHSTIRSVDLKSGSAGALVFVTLEHRLLQDGQLCLREEQTLVYRSIPATATPLVPGTPAPRDADHSYSIPLTPILLFRFSALTYNSHRIHYDREYAVREEFYPGLVLQAPLQAILLLDVAQRISPSAPIHRFSFRAVRPVIDVGDLTLRGKQNGNELRLCTADHQNYLGVHAVAVLGNPV